MSDGPQPSLAEIVTDFAAGFLAADGRGLKCDFGLGLAPRVEREVVSLVLGEMRTARPGRYGAAHAEVEYPGSAQCCDIGIDDPLSWVIEIKAARAFRGKVGTGMEPASATHILSPWQPHDSALTDTVKLATSSFPAAVRRAVLIYGYDYDSAPLPLIIEAFELLARQRVRLGERMSAPLPALVHAVHRRGAVHAWEVHSL